MQVHKQEVAYVPYMRWGDDCSQGWDWNQSREFDYLIFLNIILFIRYIEENFLKLLV